MLDKTHVEIMMSEYIDLGYGDYDKDLSRQLQSCFARLVYMSDPAKYDCKRKLIDSAIDSEIMYRELARKHKQDKLDSDYIPTGDEINAEIDAKTDVGIQASGSNSGKAYSADKADHLYHFHQEEGML